MSAKISVKLIKAAEGLVVSDIVIASQDVDEIVEAYRKIKASLVKENKTRLGFMP